MWPRRWGLKRPGGRACWWLHSPRTPQPPLPAYIDNQSTITRIGSGKSSEAQKTTDCMYHDIRGACERGEIILRYCPIKVMPEECLPKALIAPQIGNLLPLPGISTRVDRIPSPRSGKARIN